MPRPREFERSKVLHQAMNVFWAKGYEATSIGDLTEATSLKPGSLYNAFGSKHALYLETLDYYTKHVGNCLFDILYEPISGMDAIHTLFETLVDEAINDQRGCFMQNAITELSASDLEVAERGCAAVDGGKMAFRAALERARDAQEIEAELDVDKLAAYLISMVYAIRTMARTTESRADLQAIVEVALSVLD